MTSSKRKRRGRSGPAYGDLPPDAGPEIVRHAPARGPVVAWRPRKMWMTPDGEWVAVDASFAGYSAVRIGDAFDRMAEQQSRRRRGRAVDPIPPMLVAVGRYYRALTERHEAAGIRCSSLETDTRGTGGHAGWIEAVLRDRARLEALHRRIGDGVALPIRRIRPSARGAREAITDRQLVDAVCLGDMTLTEVLRAHGWSVCGETLRASRRALIEALERMQTAGETMAY